MTKIRKLIQEITKSCRICIECKQNTCADRGLVGALPIPELGNQSLYVDFVEVPKFGGLNYILMVCCALTRFCRVYPCTKRIDGEQAFEIPFKEWIQVYGRPVEVYSDNDVRFTSEKRYWRGLLSRMVVRVQFSIPYKPSSNGLCERLNESFINIMRVLRRQQRGKDWLRLLPYANWILNSQQSTRTGYSPHELFLVRPEWNLDFPVPSELSVPVEDWLEGEQRLCDLAKDKLRAFREKCLSRTDWKRVPANY